MENKQKTIEKAYGEHWESVKDYVDENGWIDFLQDSKRIRDFFHDSDNIELYLSMWRPKSLQGIETNNGWIKIESEADLPKEDGFYWVIDTDSNEVIDRYFENGNHNYFKQFSSHYQPIIKPKPPIY